MRYPAVRKCCCLGAALELTAVRLHAKFEVSSFNRSRDIRGSQNPNSGSLDPYMTPFDLILLFLC